MPEFSEGQQPMNPPVEAVEQQIPYEDKQAALGKEWAAIYSDSNRQPTTTAEIVLRNPAVYSRDIEKYSLPEDLKSEWEKLSEFSDSVSTIASLRSTDWGNISGLDRIQIMVRSGEVNPNFRGTFGDIMKVASDLFSRSVKLAPGSAEIRPGMEKYYQGNVVGAESWIRKYRQVQPVNTPQQV